MASIPCKTNPMGKTKENYFSLIVKPGILGDMEYGFTPYWNAGGYCRVLDWGDGIAEDAVASGTVLSHTYSVAGTYKIKIVADCYRFLFGYRQNYSQLIYDSNGNWNALGVLTSGSNMFSYAENAVFSFSKFPEYISNIYYMFAYCSSAKLAFNAFPEHLTQVTACFQGCNLSPLPFDRIPDIKEVSYLFSDTTNAKFHITELGNTIKMATNLFRNCSEGYIKITKIPDYLENAEGMFGSCPNAYINLDNLVRNAPSEGWVNLKIVQAMFYQCPNVTGSRSAFLAKCPNATVTDSTFAGTNTTE